MSPQYRAEEHSFYVDLLDVELTRRDPPRNIALAGAYGSGKSSVLQGLRERLGEKPAPIEVSLATLTNSEDELKGITGESSLTSALQKEIVKRLLYSVKPNDLPASRFTRIRGWRWRPALVLAGITSLVVLAFAYMFDRPTPLWKATGEWPQVTLSNVDLELAWLGPVLDWLWIASLLFLASSAFASFTVREIGLGPARLVLDAKDGNYFDTYLDEIVYFFEKSKKKVVIFEDLDRFNDPGIYQALRELNNLIKGSIQVEQPVTFVYAMRDSLFEEPAARGQSGVAANSPGMHAESPAASRAKFFDLIIPIVPFISHEVAADLMDSLLADLPGNRQPSQRLLVLAGRYVTDMRVILNVRNEYVVFTDRLIDGAALDVLATDQLFAMTLFKNLMPGDFEKVRTGTSCLDGLARDLSAATQSRLSALDKAIAELEDSAQQSTRVENRARRAGARLQRGIATAFRVGRGVEASSPVVIFPGGESFDTAQLASRKFWETLNEAPRKQLTVTSSGAQGSINDADLEVFLGTDYPLSWIQNERDAAESGLAEARELKERLLLASWQDRLRDSTFDGPDLDGETIDFQQTAREATGGGLLLELLLGGYIDQNFSLYTTVFHGRLVSAQARTYQVQHVDRHTADSIFQLSDSDVDQLIDRTDGRLLRDPSGLNVWVVRRAIQRGEADALVLLLLQIDAKQLEDFLLRFVTTCGEGEIAEWLVKAVAGEWGELLDVLATTDRLPESQRLSLLSASFESLRPGLEYSLSQATIELLDRSFEQMPAVTRPMQDHAADAAAAVAERAELVVEDLARIPLPLRLALARRGVFLVSRSNLESVTDGERGISLDAILDVSIDVLHHIAGQVDRYAAALGEGPILADHRRFEELVDVLSDNHALLDLLLRRAPEDCSYRDVGTVDADVASSLARHQRFPLTPGNVVGYVSSVGEVDANLANYLERSRLSIAADGSDSDERKTAASTVLKTGELTSARKLELLDSLNLDHVLTLSDVGPLDSELITGLFERGFIPDDSATLTALLAQGDELFLAMANVSSRLDDQLPGVPLDDARLGGLMNHDATSGHLVRAVASRLPQLTAGLGPRSSGQVFDACRREGVQLDPTQVRLLLDHQATAKSAIAYLGSNTSLLSDPDLVSLVEALPAPYATMLHQPTDVRVPVVDGLAPILNRLKEIGVIRRSLVRGDSAFIYPR